MQEDHVCALVKKHVDALRKALHHEQQSELSSQQSMLSNQSMQQLQKNGVALLNLQVEQVAVGLAGKILVEVRKSSAVGGGGLGAHCIRVGDIVKIEKADGNPSEENKHEGIVSRVTDAMIQIAFKEALPAHWTERLRIIKLINEVSYQRMFKALDQLEQAKESQDLLQSVFDPSSVPENDGYDDEIVNFYNETLNEGQKEACRKCISAKWLTLIHGPPGTGKTETLVEVIRQIARPKNQRKKKRLLACGPSNLSVDNLVERLGNDRQLKIVRLGHPARILPSVLKFCLDSQLQHADSFELIRNVRKEIEANLVALQKSRGTDKRSIYAEIRDLRKELKTREKRALKEIINGSDVILCTLNLAGGKLLDGVRFDVAVIDEGSQALEAECWLAGLKADKLIFAGDHQQLPPTLMEDSPILSNTLFNRLAKQKEPFVSLLTRQYRMHENIMKWSSIEFYKGKLIADESVATGLLKDLPGIEKCEITEEAFLFLDTCSFANECSEEDSKFNEGEAKLAVEHLERLLLSGIKSCDIAIITPYNAQVSHLRSLIAHSEVEVGTVDGFQGREKQVIIISLVRSNDQGEIGFLKDYRRTNVAVTRAKRHVCVIGDGDTLGRDPFYKRLVTHVHNSKLFIYILYCACRLITLKRMEQSIIPLIITKYQYLILLLFLL